MNCQLCQKELDSYLGRKLSRDMMTQVESHLESCNTCSSFYRMQVLADKIIAQEKELQPDPSLTARIMAVIEKPDAARHQTETLFTRVFRPMFLTASVAAAIFIGIFLGSISARAVNNEKIPVELALIDDASIESVNILSNE